MWGQLLSRAVRTTHCRSSSCWGAQALGWLGFSSCSSAPPRVHFRGLEHRLSCGARTQLLCGPWTPPGPGIKPVSPALDPAPLSHQGSPSPQHFLISIFNLTYRELWSILLVSLFGLGMREAFHNVAVIAIIAQLAQ